MSDRRRVGARPAAATARLTTPSERDLRTVVETRIAYDTQVSPLARRLYIALCGEGAWARAIEVSTREWGHRLRVETESIRAALRQLAASGYIQRAIRPGARTQRVQAVGPVVANTTT